MKDLRIKGITIALLLASFFIACGGGNDKKSSNVAISIAPQSANNDLGTTRAFTVTVTGSTNTSYTVSAPAGAGCQTGAQSGNTFSCTPTAAGAHTITVTASADTSKTQSAVLNASAPFSSAPETASTVCSDPIGTGTDRARIAVASNFYAPAQNLVRDWFQASQTHGAGTSVIVCHDSTGNLRAEINGGYLGYAMLFTADETAQNYDSAGSTSFVYAKGVPLLAAKKNVISSVGGLVTHAPALTGDVYSITESPATLSANYQINTASAEKVSVADPGQAPYGVAAQLILNSMMGANIPAVLPDWVFSGGNVANGLWNNIDRTFAAIEQNSITISGTVHDTTSVNSGIIGKSQICNEIAPNAAVPAWVYVEFTHPDFIRNQKAILLDTENSAASKLNGYIQYAMGTGDWGNFLSGNCYLPVD